LCNKNNLKLKEFNAVSVINGPGSYTGLRVGLAAAKGICYANELPLICINTLEWIAYGNKEQAIDLIAPMIDARRMEVFTAVYSKEMKMVTTATSLILDEHSYSSLLSSNRILFVGDGATKWKNISKHPNGYFVEANHNENHHAELTSNYYNKQFFSSVLTASPFYTKDFYSTHKL
jgi:tRNA threonylcarbamoyladenosine biosynthesis protein TsaB